MADKSIDQLIAADQILPTDLFVLQQSNMAKKLTGQVLLNWLTAAADGHGGISSIEKISTNVLVDTYRITLADTTTFDFVVTNGRSINTIVKVGTANLVDTYQINYNDGTTGTFNITNGAKGDKGDNAYIWIKYASQKPTASSHSFGDVVDDWIGIYYGTSATAPTDWQQYEWFQIKGEKGDPGIPATLVSSVTDYQTSDSGTVIPSGAWLSSVPVVAQGKYLWTRTTNTFNTGAPAVSYSVSRMGIDGTGSVSSVANISPDADGNIPLTASDVGALPTNGGDLTGELRMNGQPISGLNVPNANDQAANMGFVNQQVKKAAPRNLLDNSDFTKPVNTGGLTSLVANGSVYQQFLDRWLHADFTGAGVTFTLTDEGVAVTKGTGFFYQRYKKGHLKEGVAYTLALYYADGTVDVRQKAYPTLVVSTANESYDQLYFTVDAGKTASKVAVYEGVYTTENLPEYKPKGYEHELLICRQYDPATGEYIGLRKFGQPRNLLDNSNFTNPVNQSGEESYEMTAVWTPTINNWAGTYATVSVHDGFVKFKAEKIVQYKRFGQYVNAPVEVGKTYTMAMCAKINDIGGYFTFRPMDNLAGVSGALGVNISVKPDDYEVFTYSFTLATKPTKLGIEILMAKNAETYADIDIKWLALYEGVYTVDTLPEYQSKGYEQELFICNQYDLSTGKYIGLRKFSTAHNLLDNSDFTNPVNQRGKTSYTGNTFTIDKWCTTNAVTTHELTPKGLKVSGTTSAIHSIQTTLENPAQYVGKTMTLCAFIEENNASVPPQLAIHYGNASNNQTINSGISYTIPLGATGLVLATGVMADMGSYAYANPNIRIGSGTGSLVVKWMALYEGLYTVETLPEYQPKGKQVEALNCGAIPGPIDLLWENASPTSDFAAQTVAVDLSLYNWVLIETNFSNEYSERTTMLAPIIVGNTYSIMMNRASSTVARRFFTLAETGIDFSNGASGSSNGAKYMIPTKIYGVKG